METYIAIIGFVSVAAITPGPNNVLVLSAAARGGTTAAAPVIAGVIGGSMALLTLVWFGASNLLQSNPLLSTSLKAAGCLYLGYVGWTMVWRTQKTQPASHTEAPQGLTGTVVGVAAFQLLNPKSWVMVATASASAMNTKDPLLAVNTTPSYVTLAAIFTIVPLICLSVWMLAGRTISRWLSQPESTRWFDRTMGGLLIVSASLLAV